MTQALVGIVLKCFRQNIGVGIYLGFLYNLLNSIRKNGFLSLNYHPKPRKWCTRSGDTSKYFTIHQLIQNTM